MEPYRDIVILAALMIGYALVSARLRTLTGPIVFCVAGWLIGPGVLDWVNLDIGNELVRTLAELTLVLVLFGDASRIDLRVLRRNLAVPGRLLGIGLPLTFAAGLGAAAVLFADLTMWEAAILAVILAPTDAALGAAVVANERVPARVRQALNVESGLNDGLCVPLLAIFVAGAAAAGDAPTFRPNRSRASKRPATCSAR